MDLTATTKGTLHAFSFTQTACIATLAFIITTLIGPSTNLLAQSGSSNSPIQAAPPKERGADVGDITANVNRDPSNVIADVVFRGNSLLQDYELDRNIGTRPGRFFDPDQLQTDVDKLWRLPQIKRIQGPFIDRTPQGLVITFDIEEREHIRAVEFIGNRGLTDRQLLKEADIDVNQPLDLHKVRQAKNRLEEFYREKGYPRTQVEVLNIDEVENGNVKFLVHEDEKQRIWKVEFVGNQFASDARLRNFINAKPGIFKLIGGTAQQSEIEQDIVRLESYYKSFGYFNARIGREVEEVSNARWLYIRYIIDEGPRYKVRQVSFIGNSAFSSDQLDSVIELKPGSDLSLIHI